MPKVYIELLPGAIAPEKAHPSDACYDVFSNERKLVVYPQRQLIIGLGFKVAIPVGWQMKLIPKSGIADKYSVSITNTPGTIDSGYRDEVKAIIINHGIRPFGIKRGQKIAQIELQKVYETEFEIVDNVKAIGADRGGGFGSSGLEAKNRHSQNNNEQQDKNQSYKLDQEQPILPEEDEPDQENLESIKQPKIATRNSRTKKRKQSSKKVRV